MQAHGGVLVKRDDLYDVGGSRGGKVRTCMALALAAQAEGREGLVTAGSRHSPQVNIVATVARHLGLACRVHVPSGALTAELQAAQDAGATLVQHRPGYNTVIVARARTDAQERGWAEVPFGMEHPEAVEQTASAVASLHGHTFTRLVVPVGSGMSAAGILAGLQREGIDVPVLGVQVGADPAQRLDTYAPGWQQRMTLVVSELKYEQHAPTTTLGDVQLDPVYEAKCLPYLADGDLLWVVGIRATTAAPRPPQAPDGLRHQVRPELVDQGLLVPIDLLTPYPDNPNNGDTEALAESLQVNGQYRPVVSWRQPGHDTEVILAGNTTYAAAMGLGWTGIARTYITADTEQEARRILLADNRYARLARMDEAQELALLFGLDDLAGTGYTDDGLAELARIVDGLPDLPLDLPAPDTGEAGPTLAERFGVPPFTVLDARQGSWCARKRDWLDIGIRSEVGRDDDVLFQDPKLKHTSHYSQEKKRLRSEEGRPANLTGLASAAAAKARYDGTKAPGAEGGGYGTGTSVFDPVLCELTYRWYSRAGHQVLDPWAGGSVRGIVAGRLGRAYTGVELRPEQVVANEAQLGLLLDGDPVPSYLTGDSRQVLAEQPSNSYDLLFSCPPYYGLEKYSDDPRDLSNMSRAGFEAEYRATVAEAARCLRPDSFACLVVGNVRAPNGALQDLAGLTTDAMAQVGMVLYNDAVLVTRVGSLPVRAGRAFVASRVLGRTHQYVLTFLKGERKRATARAGEVDLAGTLAAVEALAADQNDDEG